ncbi:MAG: sensor histidine kinase [Chryseotalea sp.]
MKNFSLSKEVMFHILFWVLYLFIRVFIIELYPGNFYFKIQAELIEIPLKITALYFAIFVLIHKLLLAKQYTLFVFSFLVYVVAVMLLNRVEDYYIIYPFTGSELTKYSLGFWNIKVAFLNLIYIYPVVGLGIAIYFVKSWFENQLIKEKLAREKAEFELKALKDQIHPHFLFNTLNNIFSLALNQSQHTPEMMLRLSNLLSYMLYEGSNETVILQRELQALKDYIELEKLRLGERLELSFETVGEVENVKIAPLLLFPLLENCFKHGSHSTMEKSWIRFSTQVKSNKMYFQFENSMNGNDVKENPSGGIGLSNIKRRLSLLYPQHEMRIHKSDTYLVYLKITLS